MRYGPCAIFRGISKSCRAEIVEGLNTIMACHNFSGIQHAPNKRRRFCAHQAFVVGEVVQSFKRRNRNQFGHLISIWPHVRSALALVNVAPDKNVIFLYFGNAPVWVQWALAGLIASIGHSRTDMRQTGNAYSTLSKIHPSQPICAC